MHMYVQITVVNWRCPGQCCSSGLSNGGDTSFQVRRPLADQFADGSLPDVVADGPSTNITSTSSIDSTVVNYTDGPVTSLLLKKRPVFCRVWPSHVSRLSFLTEVD